MDESPATPTTSGPGTPDRPRPARDVRRGTLRVLIVATLLGVHWLLAVSASWSKSITFDELAHQTGGLSYWRTGDFRLHPENGNLPQRLAALPLLWQHARFPDLDQQAWRDSDVWELGHQLHFGIGNDADRMLRSGRMLMALVSCVLGLLVFGWSRRLFGFPGALLALAAYALSPTALAHAPLMTSDVTAAACFLAAVGCYWRQLQRTTPITMILGGLSFGALFLAKMSALLVLPMCAVLLAIRTASDRPWILPWRRSTTVIGWPGRALAGALVLASNLAIAWLLIWAAYGFRFAALRDGAPGREELYFSDSWQRLAEQGGLAASTIGLLREHRVLPEAYLYGLTVSVTKAQKRRAFMAGQSSEAGWPSFFPYAFAIKTSLSELALVLLATAAAVQYCRSRRRQPEQRRATIRDLAYATAPLLVLWVVYWAFAIPSRLNIGHRHLLPIYPVLWILAGGAATWLGDRPRARLLIGIPIAALMAECLLIWPDYLAYFNPFAGGPSQGYRRLVDSSLDWGQDLPGLERWLDRHALDGRDSKAVYLSYFGSSLPSHYGIRARMLPSYLPIGEAEEPRDLAPGVYCVSATMLQAVYLKCPGHWCPLYEQRYRLASERLQTWRKTEGQAAARQALIDRIGEDRWLDEFEAYEHLRFSRLAAHLRQREPDAMIGYSILIFRVGEQELHDALFGPPAELDQDPPLKSP